MKNDNENTDMQIMFDGFTQILDEIKEAVTKSPSLALTTDLLSSKIQQTIDQSKRGITAEELKVFGEELINNIKALQQDANESVEEFLNLKVEELREIAKQPNVITNKYSIDYKLSKTFIVILYLFLGIGGSLYFKYKQFQENKMLKTNDIKYRYIQMKGGVSYDDIVYPNKYYTEKPHYQNSIKIHLNLNL